MVREPWDRKIDEWLDTALSEYGRAEPRAGMEARIVERLRSRPIRRSWWRVWRPTVWIPAAVALVLIVMTMLFSERPKLPMPDFAAGYDQDLLVGVSRMINQNVPAALEPAALITKEITKDEKQH
ncbi:MAG: hypothetical protein ABSC02_07165 [Acidobacteriota bacterium]|jgi:hypothetical protein